MLREQIVAKNPAWLQDQIVLWNNHEFEHQRKFLTMTCVDEAGLVPLHRIVGTTRSDYHGMTWGQFLQQGPRMNANLQLYANHPQYYTLPVVKTPPIEVITLDQGQTYYVGQDGLHRVCLAKCAGALTGHQSLDGVRVVTHQMDTPHAHLYSELTSLLQALQARRATRQEFANTTLEATNEQVHEEVSVTWARRYYQPRIRLSTVSPASTTFLGREEAAAIRQDWARRYASTQWWAIESWFRRTQ